MLTEVELITRIHLNYISKKEDIIGRKKLRPAIRITIIQNIKSGQVRQAADYTSLFRQGSERRKKDSIDKGKIRQKGKK